MATLAERLPDNAPGLFYVDRSCIDCDATNEWPSPSAKTAGATRRQVSQSMHERST